MVLDADQTINSLTASLFYFLPSLWVEMGEMPSVPPALFWRVCPLKWITDQEKSPPVRALVQIYCIWGAIRKVQTHVRCPKHTGNIYPSLVMF